MLLKTLFEAEEMHVAELILARFEQGEMSYDQAWAEIKANVPEDEWFFWEMELGAAQDLMADDMAVQNQHAAPKRVQ